MKIPKIKKLDLKRAFIFENTGPGVGETRKGWHDLKSHLLGIVKVIDEFRQNAKQQ